MDDYSLEDSGERTVLETGAMRELVPASKGRYDLISPIAVKRLAVLLAKGAEKYEARNWERGHNLSSYVDSALRHLFRFLEGDESEDHAAAAMWNLHCLIHVQEMIRRGLLPETLDDLPSYIDPTQELFQ